MKLQNILWIVLNFPQRNSKICLSLQTFRINYIESTVTFLFRMRILLPLIMDDFPLSQETIFNGKSEV